MIYVGAVSSKVQAMCSVHAGASHAMTQLSRDMSATREETLDRFLGFCFEMCAPTSTRQHQKLTYQGDAVPCPRGRPRRCPMPSASANIKPPVTSSRNTHLADHTAASSRHRARPPLLHRTPCTRDLCHATPV
jgi:hypothetical protein